MRCDYWTLMSQPRRFVELYQLYLEMDGRVRAEENKRMERETQRMKQKAGGKSRGR